MFTVVFKRGDTFAGCEAGAQVTPEVPVSANAVVGAVPPESRLKVTVAASLLAVVCAVVIGIMGYSLYHSPCITV